tara:strand:+ start:75 stop:284 length:210 start_codon:yes stop_codon:yes gene_type:complete
MLDILRSISGSGNIPQCPSMKGKCGAPGKVNHLAGRWLHTLLHCLMQACAVHGTHAQDAQNNALWAHLQ